MSTSKLYALTDAQHATVLAALRFYQEEGMGDPAKRSDAIHFIASNGNVVDPGLDAAGIDALCESLNHDGLDFGACVNLFGEDDDEPYVAAAIKKQHDSELEVDLPAVVSRGADDGAYVMAWVWVSNEDAGIPPGSDAEDDGTAGEPA